MWMVSQSRARSATGQEPAARQALAAAAIRPIALVPERTAWGLFIPFGEVVPRAR